MCKKNEDNKILCYGCTIELMLLGIIAYAYTLHLYAGIIATGLWLFGIFACAGPISSILLELFFPVERLHDTLYGKSTFLEVLQPPSTKSEEPSSQHPQLQEKIGKKAITLTDLKPQGKVLVDDERFQAKTSLGFIESDTEVLIVAVEKETLVVEVSDRSR